MSSTNTPVRVRFAPSPTGQLHIGSIRSGLFNWLWARHNHGVYILRIEDTDRARLVEGAVEQIDSSHESLGIIPDEGPSQGGKFGPYLQSERLDIYRTHADILVASGALYPCWCTPERLSTLRAAAQAHGVAFKYDRHCLKPENQRPAAEPHVLRFRIPDTAGTISWDDAVRGQLSFEAKELDDYVAIKADGYPTYHFANVVDDHLMEISHVLRADEWIPSTPKHLLLFAAFGWKPPTYAHLPAVLGPTGTKKLSKRDGAQSIHEYVDQGFLPEALRSFLASLGWNDGTTQEVYSTDELVKNFTLERIQKSPAKFDLERLTWVNGLMIRQMDVGELLKRCKAYWPASAKSFDSQYQIGVLKLIQERLKLLSELPELTEFFFTDPKIPTNLLSDHLAKSDPAHQAATIIDKAATALSKIDEFDEPSIKAALEQLEQNIPAEPGKNSRKLVFGLLRIAISGLPGSPPLFSTLAALGRTTVLRRLSSARNLLNR